LIDKRYIKGLIIALAGAIIAINIVVAGTSSPLFCATCHRSQAEALESTPHKITRCNSCHQRNDIFDIVSWRVKVLGMVARQATFSYKQPVIANVSRGSCIRCHQNILTEVTKRNAIKVSHKEIDDASFKCAECHNTVAHPGAVTSPKFPEMDKCATCHNDQQASVSCGVCHMKEVDKRKRVRTSWSVTHGPEWKRLHGMGNLDTCRSCHDGDDCLRCHNTALPHPDFWAKLHSRHAKADLDGCYQCHHKAYCLSCHGTVMPHAEDFLKRHGRDVKDNGKELCQKCHLDSGCDNCHTRHIHPGIPGEKLKKLRRSAGLGG